MRLQGKVVLLSGVGPGMGRAAAILFSQEGAKVAIVARRRDHLEETLTRVQSSGGEATALAGDVSVEADADRVVAETLQRFGGIDVLYSGGGGFFEPTRRLDQTDGAFWRQALTNNLDGIFNLVRAVRPTMKARGGGSVIIVSASRSVRQEGNPSYGAAKGGLIGFAQNVARELYSDNIRVNVVAPGLIRGRLGEGPVTPPEGKVRRRGFPQDIAYAALYLASDEAAWLTGQVLAVDGGVDVGARGLWDLER